jgi:leukotriene-A4 hydrolase
MTNLSGALLALMLTATGAGTDPHSFGNAAAVVPRHMALDLTLDFTRKVVHGSCELTLAYPDTAAATHLDLDSESLKVAKVINLDSGAPLQFALEAAVPVLGERLRIELGAARPHRVRIDYETSPSASALQWLEPRQTTSGKLPFLFTQGESIHTRSWIPSMDSPGVRMTYDAVIHAPVGMNVVMSAEHVEDSPAKGLFRFHMPQAIPSYLMALAAGEIAFRPISARAGVYAEPAVVDKARSEFQDAEKMIQVAESLYGPYAWGRWDTIVLPPSFPFGGMENPRITFATPTIIAGDRSLVNVLAHELAHSWSGNLVTNASWSDMWLNEGFTSYIEGRIDEALYGVEQARMEVILGQAALKSAVADPHRKPELSRLAADVSQGDPDDMASTVAYVKGAEFLRMLEVLFGRPAFDAFLRGYFKANAFGSMSTLRFLEILKRDVFHGDESAWQSAQVEEWIHGNDIPDNQVVPTSERFEKIRIAVESFGKTGSLGPTLAAWSSWSTPERRFFLSNLPRELTEDQLMALDTGLHLSESHNDEVLAAWLRVAVRNDFSPAYPAAERFLTSQGRIKYLRPLYRALLANPKTAGLARTIYAKARPSYHPMAAASVDALLKGDSADN